MGQCRSPSVSPSRQAMASSAQVQEELSLFQQYLQEGNPFEMHIEHKEEETEDVLASNGVSVKSGQLHRNSLLLSLWSRSHRISVKSSLIVVSIYCPPHTLCCFPLCGLSVCLSYLIS